VLQWEIVFLDTLFESEDGRWLCGGGGGEKKGGENTGADAPREKTTKNRGSENIYKGGLKWEVFFLDTLFESEDGRWLWGGGGGRKHSDRIQRPTSLTIKQY